jgi:hypothetical protein
MPSVLGSAADPATLRAWTILCLAMYVACRVEPVITAIAARGHAGLNAAAALTSAVVCLAVWLVGAPAGGILLALAAGTLAQSLTTPALASALDRRSGGRLQGHGLRWVAGDAAVSAGGACLLVAPTDPTWLAAAAIILIAAIVLESWRFARSRRARGPS